MAEDSGLDLLIETEARLAERLAAAQAEAEAILESARQSAREAEARYQAELEAAFRALTERLAAERSGQLARIGAEADAASRRFEALGPEEIETLAREVVRQVLDAWRVKEPP